MASRGEDRSATEFDDFGEADRHRRVAPGRSVPGICNLRNKLGVYARLRGFEPTFAWSREVNPNGTGEHLHVLMHVPAKHRSDFETTLMGWYPGPAEADVRKADQRTRFTYAGKRHSALGYICKQMTTQAWYGRGLTRKAGGPVLGKRGGTTKNLDRQARAAFRASWPAYSGQPAQPAMSRAPVAGAAADAASTSMASQPIRAGAFR